MRENPAGGGIVYYGHSTDTTDGDFRAAMSALTSSGHMTITYSTTGIILKYDWMGTGKWVAALSDESGFGYTVFKSTTGDVFCSFTGGSARHTAPDYVGSGISNNSRVWSPSSSFPDGATDTASNLSLVILKSTDIVGDNEAYQYGIYTTVSNYYNWRVYPDTITGPVTNADINMSINSPSTGWKYTVLSPLTTGWCSGIPTYARYAQKTVSDISNGAYTCGGFNFRVCGGSQYTRIWLRNNAVSS